MNGKKIYTVVIDGGNVISLRPCSNLDNAIRTFYGETEYFATQFGGKEVETFVTGNKYFDYRAIIYYGNGEEYARIYISEDVLNAYIP